MYDSPWEEHKATEGYPGLPRATQGDQGLPRGRLPKVEATQEERQREREMEWASSFWCALRRNKMGEPTPANPEHDISSKPNGN